MMREIWTMSNMPSQMAKAEAFKALHEAPEIFVIPNPWDPGSARMLEVAGFKALATTSAGYAFSAGLGDGDITLDQKLAHCEAICASTRLPVSADMENCFADDPAGVAETVHRAAATGLVGCSVEDFARENPPTIYDFDHAVERVAAAVEAARAAPFPFTLTARAEGVLRGLGDLDDAIRRLQAFEKTGADVLYVPGLRTIDEVKTVMSAVTKPINVLATTDMNVAELGAVGVRRISLGGSLFRAAMGGFFRTVDEIANKGTFTDLKNAASGSDIAGKLKKWSS
jgi:2-methylisocitrate lyase-like PEP mutase family enzyme